MKKIPTFIGWAVILMAFSFAVNMFLSWLPEWLAVGLWVLALAFVAYIITDITPRTPGDPQ